MFVALCWFDSIINVGSMLGQCRRRWTNINSALGQRVVIIGITQLFVSKHHTKAKFFFQKTRLNEHYVLVVSRFPGSFIHWAYRHHTQE